MVVIESSSTLELFKNSNEGTVMHKVYHTTMKDNPTAFIMDGPNFLEDILKREKALYFGSALNVVGYPNYTVLDIDEKIRVYHVWTLKKGSELTPLFNYHLLKVRESGVMKDIFQVSSVVI